MKLSSSSSALGTAANTGVYTGTSVGTDGIFTGTSGQSRAVGLQIGGLSTGTYDLYVTGRNTNISATHVQNFYASKSSSAVDFDFSAFTTKALSFGNTSTGATSSWTDTANYMKFSITLSSGEFLNIASIGGTGEARGFLNSIQIVNASAPPSAQTAIPPTCPSTCGISSPASDAASQAAHDELIVLQKAPPMKAPARLF